MTPTRSLPVGRYPLLLLIAAVVATCLPFRASAQEVYTEEVEAKLRTKVHLTLGATTIAQVMAALSEQTGLNIEAADYLREHKLTMQMEDVTAAATLNTLVELYGWVWRETEGKRVLLTHPTLRTSQQITGVAAALRKVVPQDFHRFLGLDGMPAAPPLDTRPQPGLPPPVTPAFGRASNLQTHFAVEQFKDTLVDSLKSGLLSGKTIPYAKLTASQQHDLLVALVLDAMERLNTDIDHDLLLGQLDPFEQDFNIAEIHLSTDNQMFMIGTTRMEGRVRHLLMFGVPLRMTFRGQEIDPSLLK